jgi:hypothetical protein
MSFFSGLSINSTSEVKMSVLDNILVTLFPMESWQAHLNLMLKLFRKTKLRLIHSFLNIQYLCTVEAYR